MQKESKDARITEILGRVMFMGTLRSLLYKTEPTSAYHDLAAVSVANWSGVRPLAISSR